MEWIITKPDGLGNAVATLTGDCDMYTAPTFHAAMSGLLDSEQTLHLDFTSVPYLDSSGVGAIIRLLQKAKAQGKGLSFSGISGTPRKVLTMANILPLLKEKVQ